MNKFIIIFLSLFSPILGIGQGSNLTAEDYFYKAYNNQSDYQYQIDNYTKCLRIDPDYANAYFNRGLAYHNLGNYNDAIADCTRTLRVESIYNLLYKLNNAF